MSLRTILRRRAAADHDRTDGPSSSNPIDSSASIAYQRSVRRRIADYINAVRSRTQSRVPPLEQTSDVAPAQTIVSLSPSPITSVLPVELWLIIIDGLQNDPETLLRCAAVCHSWRIRCLYHLRDVPVGCDVVDITHRMEVVRIGKRSSKRWKGPTGVNIRSSSDGPERSPLSHLGTFAAMLAGKWTRVRELSIENGEWRAEGMHPDVFLHLSAFSSITDLRLRAVVFPSVLTFGRLLCALPSLEKLDCSDVGLSRRFDARAFSTRRWGVKLSEIRLDGPSMGDIAAFMAGADLASNLGKIILGNLPTTRLLRTAEFQSLQRFVQAAGASLCTLMLPRMVLGGRYVDLSLNTKLEQIVINLEINYMNFDHGWVSNVLSHLTSNVMNTVHLVVDIRRLIRQNPQGSKVILTRLSQDCFAPLDRVFSLPMFSNLRTVILHVLVPQQTVANGGLSGWAEQLHSQLPMTHERGIMYSNLFRL